MLTNGVKSRLSVVNMTFMSFGRLYTTYIMNLAKQRHSLILSGVSTPSVLNKLRNNAISFIKGF